MQVSEAIFRQWKKQCLEDHPDQSRKGGIDEKIVHLVDVINSQSDYFTTSSCSGRLICYTEDVPGQKRGCQWLMVSHSEISLDALVGALGSLPANGCVFFKFEPFVLHMCCRTLEGARRNMGWAVDAGFRNSGLSIGKHDKIVLAVRSTHSLEAPIALNGRITVSELYLKHLVELGNHKMAENLHRIDRFEHNIIDGLKGATQDHMQVTRKSHAHHPTFKPKPKDNNDIIPKKVMDTEFDYSKEFCTLFEHK